MRFKLLIIFLMIAAAACGQIQDILGTDTPNAGRIKINSNFDYVDGVLTAMPGWIRDSLNVYRTDGLLDTIALADDQWIWYVRIHQYNKIKDLYDVTPLPYGAYFPKDMIWREEDSENFQIVKWVDLLDTLAIDSAFVYNIAHNIDSLYIWDAKDSLAFNHFFRWGDGNLYHVRQAGLDSVFAVAGAGLSGGGTRTVAINAGLGTEIVNDSLRVDVAAGGGILRYEAGVLLDDTDARNWAYNAPHSHGSQYVDNYLYFIDVGYGIVMADTGGTNRLVTWISTDKNWFNLGNAGIQTRINAKDTLYINADYTLIQDALLIEQTGVLITSDNDGALTLQGQSSGYDESITLNLDDYDNSLTLSTGSGITKIDAGTIAWEGAHNSSDGTAGASSTQGGMVYKDGLYTSGIFTEVDGSTTNEIEVVDEAYSAANFNGGTTSAVSQDDFYDYQHIADTDDDGKIQIVDLASAGFVKTDVSGNLSVDANTYLTAEVDGSTTNEIEVQNETYNSTNFNGDNTHGVSQNDFYDYQHTGDTDDDALINKIDASSAGFVKSDASGILSIDGSTYLTAEVDGSTTNEIEVVDEAYSAANFNGGTTSAVSQDDFYDYQHIADTDDDGKIQIVDLASAGFVKTDVSGNLSVDANTYLTAEVDGSTTNEIEVQNETYNSTNFNGDNTHGVSQNDFYDYQHTGDTDDDALVNKIDASSAGFVKSDASGILSIDGNTYLTAEVDGSTTNEIEVVDEAYSAANFNGGTASAVSQDDFYDYQHIADTDDDGKIQIVDLASAGFVKTDVSGNLSVDANTYLTAEVGDISSITAGTGLSGGGTSGDVTITNVYSASNALAHYAYSYNVQAGGDRYINGPGSTGSLIIRSASADGAGGTKVWGGYSWQEGATFELYDSDHATRPASFYVWYGDYNDAVSNEVVLFKHYTESSGDEDVFKLDAAKKAWLYGDLNAVGNISAASINGSTAWNGSAIGPGYIAYDTNDFSSFGGNLIIKDLGIDNAEIANSTIDTTKINDTQFYKYIEDHSAAGATSVQFWTTLWKENTEMHLDGSNDPTWYELSGLEAISTLEFDGVRTAGTEQSAAGNFHLPTNWISAGNVYWQVDCYPGGSTTSDVVWRIYFYKADNGEQYTAKDSVTITMTAAMTNLYRVVAGSSAKALTGVLPGAVVHYEIKRLPNDAGDTYTSDMYLNAVGLRMQCEGFGDVNP